MSCFKWRKTWSLRWESKWLNERTAPLSQLNNVKNVTLDVLYFFFMRFLWNLQFLKSTNKYNSWLFRYCQCFCIREINYIFGFIVKKYLSGLRSVKFLSTSFFQLFQKFIKQIINHLNLRYIALKWILHKGIKLHCTWNALLLPNYPAIGASVCFISSLIFIDRCMVHWFNTFRLFLCLQFWKDKMNFKHMNEGISTGFNVILL